jgi:hypothetical protein
MSDLSIIFDVTTNRVTMPPGWPLYPWGSIIIDAANRRAFAPSPWVAAVPSPMPPAPIDALNAARVANGLPALALSPDLEAAATNWAASMAAAGTLSHGDFSGRLWAALPGVPIGEDVAEGYATADAAVAGWMDDPPHRAILLGDYDAAGMASARGRDGNLYWVADFART